MHIDVEVHVYLILQPDELGLSCKCESKVNLDRIISVTKEADERYWPSVTVSCVYINPKVQQELHNMVMSSTDSIVQRSYPFIVGHAGVFHLEEKESWGEFRDVYASVL